MVLELTVRLGEGGGVRVWGVWADGGNMVKSKLIVKQYTTCSHTHEEKVRS